MKQLQNDTKLYNVDEKELEQDVQAQVAQFEEEEESRSRQLAIEQLPHLKRDQIVPYITPIRSKFRKLAGHVDNRLQWRKLAAENDRDNTFTNHKIQEKEEEKATCKHRCKSFQSQRDKISQTYNWKRYPFVLLVLILIGGVQIVIDGNSLQQLGFPLWMAYFFSAGIATGVISVSHYIKRILNFVNGKAKKVTLFTGLCLFFALIFLALGSFRTIMMKDTSGGWWMILGFVLLNMAIFIGSCIISYFNMPSVLDEQKKLKCQELDDEINNYTDKSKAIQDEIDTLKQALFQRIEMRKKYQEYALEMKRFLQMAYENTVGTFTATNSTSRTDGIPDCFDQDIPPLFSNNKIDTNETEN